jgi:fatty acid desaturase
MNPFRDYKFKWWEVGILKFALLLFGIAIGAYWSEVFTDWLVLIFVAAFALGIYSSYIAFKQK